MHNCGYAAQPTRFSAGPLIATQNGLIGDGAAVSSMGFQSPYAAVHSVAGPFRPQSATACEDVIGRMQTQISQLWDKLNESTHAGHEMGHIGMRSNGMNQSNDDDDNCDGNPRGNGHGGNNNNNHHQNPHPLQMVMPPFARPVSQPAAPVEQGHKVDVMYLYLMAGMWAMTMLLCVILAVSRHRRD